MFLSYMAVQALVSVVGQPCEQEPLPLQECWPLQGACVTLDIRAVTAPQAAGGTTGHQAGLAGWLWGV